MSAGGSPFPPWESGGTIIPGKFWNFKWHIPRFGAYDAYIMLQVLVHSTSAGNVLRDIDSDMRTQIESLSEFTDTSVYVATCSVLLFTRDGIYAIARICHANSVHPSVCHTRVLYQNG